MLRFSSKHLKVVTLQFRWFLEDPEPEFEGMNYKSIISLGTNRAVFGVLKGIYLNLLTTVEEVNLKIDVRNSTDLTLDPITNGFAEYGMAHAV